MDELGTASMVMFTHLLSAPGSELLNSEPQAVPLPPFGLLDTVPETALRRARMLERHLIEVETGVAPDAPVGAEPPPEYDPKWRTVDQRLTAKSAELAAAGTQLGLRSMQRLRALWRDQALWGLVDRRTMRIDSPTGRVDQRVVDVLVELLNAQTRQSTGTRSRLLRQAQQVLDERFGPGKVPLPCRSTMYRILPALAEGKHTFGSAASRRSQALRPSAPYTPSSAARPGETVQIDTTPLDVLVILDDGVTGRAELTIAVDVAARSG
jgi:hypothetical protein